MPESPTHWPPGSGGPLGPSRPGHKYDAFRRAPPAAAGTRRAPTYHQYAHAHRAPAATTGHVVGLCAVLLAAPTRPHPEGRVLRHAPFVRSDRPHGPEAIAAARE